jgi:hypothetical protein
MTATLPAQLSVAFTLSAPEQCPRHADALAWFRAALNAPDACAQYDYLSRAMRAWLITEACREAHRDNQFSRYYVPRENAN